MITRTLETHLLGRNAMYEELPKAIASEFRLYHKYSPHTDVLVNVETYPDGHDGVHSLRVVVHASSTPHIFQDVEGDNVFALALALYKKLITRNAASVRT